MQNKGFITTFAVLLSLVSLFYISFTFVTNKYYRQANEYEAAGNGIASHYLDSLSSKTVWLGYSLQKARTMEINLGLDLKGGMSVIMELSVVDVLKSLSNYNTDENFNRALALASERRNTSNKDYITLFREAYREIDAGASLSAIFSMAELREKITPNSNDNEVEAVLRAELKSAIDNSFNVLRTRIDRFGVVAPNIQKLEQDGRILIELPGIKEPERVRTLLQGSANLEFWETFQEKDIHQALLAANAIISDSIKAAEANAAATETETAPAKTAATTENTDIASSVAADNSLLLESDSAKTATVNTQSEAEQLKEYQREYPLFYALGFSPNQPLESAVIGYVPKANKPLVDRYFNMRQVKEVLPRQLNPKWTVKPRDERSDIYELVALKITTRDGRPPLEGDVITDASDRISEYGSSSEVNMTMNSEGAKRWARLTKDNIGKAIAIVLDNNVYSYPNVNQEITGGHSQITGHFTSEQAKDLANVLKSGKMSAPARIVSEEMIGPSLGQEAINTGIISFLFALAVLMAYLMIIYGWKPGLIANLALLFNLFFTIGVMASFHAVLTLSGIAGIVLALAIAVDANVLIYERIKEEIRGGKQVKKAVEEGYQKAFSAIFDSNFTSIITGVILFWFGTGPIKGFATTLIIGILISFGTAVFLTRVIYETFLSKGHLLNLTFTTAFSKKVLGFLIAPKYNFLGNRKLIYTINGIVVAICLVALFTRGLNQGIDFTGGRNFVVQFENPIENVEQVRELITNNFKDANSALAQKYPEAGITDASVSVIAIGTDGKTVRISTNCLIKNNDSGVDSDIEEQLYNSLKPLLTQNISKEIFVDRENHTGGSIISSQKVGPSVAEDIKTGAYYAVIFAVIAIGLYILLRFRDISYSIGASVALAGDAVFIIGVYAILWGLVPFSLEIDQTFIGAILTVIGYSINDKVVIFDRVREYTHLYPKRPKYELFNEALNSTLDRTFNTSMSTIIVLLVIFLFAGDSIKSFSFAMLLGVFIGTFSSLFTAAPIAYQIQEGKKK
ncbi:MAG: protein translocase subunit SecDF [Dysgonamonadaceae bacterium]|jgi:SecD/SecF fusion protein|nr:protein translocase subunit SecDF [Dysgonamonadaceae bacterium]